MTSTTDTAPTDRAPTDPAPSACATGDGVPTGTMPGSPAGSDTAAGDTATGDTAGNNAAGRRANRSAVDADPPGPVVPDTGPSPTHRVRRRRSRSVLRGDDGMSTVEYAIGTVAAAAFAAILYAVVSGDSIVGALTGIVQRALAPTF